MGIKDKLSLITNGNDSFLHEEFTLPEFQCTKQAL